MIIGAIYLALLPLLAYLTGNRDSIKVLFGLCLIILSDLIITDYFLLVDNFFLYRAVVDLTMLLFVYRAGILPLKQLIVSLCLLTSIIINVYLCFELNNVLIYRQWEVINSILCEVAFLTLLISDRVMKCSQD